MKTAALLIAILSFGSGCTPDCDNVYSYDPSDVSDVDTTAMKNAAEAIKHYINRDVQFRAMTKQSQCHITFHHNGEQIDGAEKTAGIRRQMTNNIEIESNNLVFTSLILSHEILHSFGLDHVDDPYSIMAFKTKYEASWSEFDKQECINAGVCK